MSASAKPSARAKRVWDRLQDWYGVRLTEQFGPEPPKDWCDVVDRSDNEQVKRALSVVRSDYTNFPPTFMQFEKAFKPAVKPYGQKVPSNAERLSNFVTANYRLTPKQLRGPWKYLSREFDAPDHSGKIRERNGVEITGVVIAADEQSPGYRVMLIDMEAAA
jgi:hypothetical protein